jgi:hypothetical protein
MDERSKVLMACNTEHGLEQCHALQFDGHTAMFQGPEVSSFRAESTKSSALKMKAATSSKWFHL